jgi:hypothetical protein
MGVSVFYSTIKRSNEPENWQERKFTSSDIVCQPARRFQLLIIYANDLFPQDGTDGRLKALDQIRLSWSALVLAFKK